MDPLNQISQRISQLHAGEHWTVSAQELLISRTDFQSISVFLSRESNKGDFSLQETEMPIPRAGRTSLTIIKN